MDQPDIKVLDGHWRVRNMAKRSQYIHTLGDTMYSVRRDTFLRRAENKSRKRASKGGRYECNKVVQDTRFEIALGVSDAVRQISDDKTDDAVRQISDDKTDDAVRQIRDDRA